MDGNLRPFEPELNPVKVRPVLYRESSAYSEQEVEAEPNWDYFSFTYDELPAFDDKNNEWKYRVSAESIEGYRAPECLSTSNHSATITYYPDESPVSISGTKNWIDGGKYHDNAKEVWLELWRWSRKSGTTPENISAYPTLITPSWEGNKWSFTDLPSRDSEGYPYSYYVIDKYRPEFVPYLGYKLSEYTNLDWSVTDRALDGCVITSRLVSSKTQIGGTIVWDDDVGDHNNAEEVKLVLKRVSEDPNAGGEETVDATPVWDGDTYTFGDLDVCDSNGNGYAYWVIEEKVDGYEEPEYINAGNHAAVTGRACDGATITNSKATNEVENESKTYKLSSGANGSWTKGSTTSLTFTFKNTEDDSETFEHFTGIKVDGKNVPEKDASGNANWMAKEGSVIIELQPSYLETLSVGEHKMAVQFDDGADATATFIVKANAATTSDKDTTTAPKTGDASNMLLWFLLILASLFVMFQVISLRNRRFYDR